MSNTGRYFYHDPRTGRRFCIEPISERDQKQEEKTWTNGGIDQVRGGSIREDECIITAENGFSGIATLPHGVSPDAYIEALIRGDEEEG